MRRYTAWLASVVLGALLLSGCAAPSSFFLLPEKKPAGSAAQESGEPGAAGASIAGLIGRDAEGEKGFETPEEAVLTFLEAIQTGNTKAVVALYPDEAVDYIAEKQGETPDEWRERMRSAFTKKKWPFDAYEIAEMTELTEAEIRDTYFTGYEPEEAVQATISLEKSGEKLENTPKLFAAKYGERWYITLASW
ncbi:MAG: hypothetical protein MR896_06890 [Clostridiales bacterium]|nr:hypothetical protein [Clostridiales bacterium]